MSNLVADSYHRASMSLGMLSTAAIFVLYYRLMKEVEGEQKIGLKDIRDCIEVWSWDIYTSMPEHTLREKRGRRPCHNECEKARSTAAQATWLNATAGGEGDGGRGTRATHMRIGERVDECGDESDEAGTAAGERSRMSFTI